MSALSQHTWYRRENVFTSHPDAEMTSFLSLNELRLSTLRQYVQTCLVASWKTKGCKSRAVEIHIPAQLTGFSWSDERPAE